MDQAIEQSVVDTAAEQPQETQEQPQEQTETQGAEDTTSTEDNALDYSKLGKMSQEEQLAALKKAGLYGDGDKPADKPQDPPQQQDTPEQKDDAGQGTDQPADTNEPEYEVVVDGQKVKVKQSELLSGYQRQADYTRKTQELAEQRRQVDAMMAALKVHQQTQAPEEDKPAVHGEYEQAVATAEKTLGIKPGEFNQFDPAHNFALQKVIAQQNAQQETVKEMEQEVAKFAAQAAQDPLTPQIDANFNKYIFEVGQEKPEKAMALVQAQQRLYAHTLTKADTTLLKEHWEYVKGKLTQPHAAAQPPAPKPEPPKTETPGQAQAQHRAPLDVKKIGHMSIDQQLAALRRAGIV